MLIRSGYTFIFTSVIFLIIIGTTYFLSNKTEREELTQPDEVSVEAISIDVSESEMDKLQKKIKETYAHVYGGSYFDGYKTVFLVTELGSGLEEEVLKASSDPDKVTFQKVQFTEQQLDAANELLIRRNEFGIGAVMKDIRSNKLMIIMSEENKLKYEASILSLVPPNIVTVDIGTFTIIDQ